MTPESQLLQQLPSVTKVLQNEFIRSLMERYSRDFVLKGIQDCLEELRLRIREGQISEKELSQRISTFNSAVRTRLESRISPSLRQVVNATGVIIHTNVGRAPLSPAAAEAVRQIAVSYSNLEYNLPGGTRGHRDLHFEVRMWRLLGCEAATVCNNNAAALLLILNTFALGKKVLVSRGELIEIGGSFRIPAILERSGAVLAEVGTTNKTKINDYRQAVDRETALILRVHPSNYKIVGFTHRPSLEELVELAGETGLPLVKDVGSGLLFPSNYPFLQEEPSVQAVLGQGVDLVCFSGDKLLGGPQTGIIVGKKKLVDKIRDNPLMRACRVDKMTYASLEWTLMEYEKGTYRDTVPVHRMLSASAQDIRIRAEHLRESLDTGTLEIEIKEGDSVIGGGSAPEEKIPTYLLAIRSARHSANELERRLREVPVAIVGRIEEDRLILDLRTVFPEQEDFIVSAFAAILERSTAKIRSGAGEG